MDGFKQRSDIYIIPSLPFLGVTLDAVGRIDCREEWKPTVQLGSVETTQGRDDSGLNFRGRVAIEGGYKWLHLGIYFKS